MDRHNDTMSTFQYGEDEKKLKLKSQFTVSKNNCEVTFSTEIETACADDMKIVSFTGLDKVTSLLNKTISSINCECEKLNK